VTDRVSVLGEVGDWGAPPGTRPWAVAVRDGIWSQYQDKKSAEDHLKSRVELFVEHEGWRALCDRRGRPFESWEAFCRSPRPFGLGLKPEVLEAEIDRRAKLRAGPGRPKKGEENVGVANISEGGTTAAYLVARLERDHEELAALVRAGELTAHAAAIQAGFRKRTVTLPLDPQAWARAAVKHLTKEQVRELAADLGEWVRAGAIRGVGT
jgi:hypothetical protein